MASTEEWIESLNAKYGEAGLTEDRAAELVGSRVKGFREATAGDGPQGFEANVVGFTRSFVEHDGATAEWFSLITDEGLSIGIANGMVTEVVS